MKGFAFLALLVCVCWTVGIKVDAAAATTNRPPCRRPAEVVFLIDSSRSIYPADFQRELSFVQDLIGHFDVSSTTTRVAAVSFSHGFREEFGLESYDSTAAMQMAVANIYFTAGDSTDTHDAIRYAREHVLEHARPGVTRLIICITDGQSSWSSKTVEESEKVRQEGVLMFAIGVGREVNFTELAAMATRNDSVFVHTVDDFTTLSSITGQLGEVACEATAPPMTTVVTAPPLTTTAKPCERPAEVVFLVDTSRSIYPEDFPRELRFVEDMISRFHVSPNDTRVAVISFSHGFREEFGLHTYDTADAMQRAVAGIYFTQGESTDTHDAVRYARDDALREARPGVIRIIICVTDGQSTESLKTLEEAAKVRHEGILLFAVGVGSKVNFTELSAMATRNDSVFVHTVDDFAALSSIIAKLGQEACEVTAPPVTTTPAPSTTHHPQNNQSHAEEVCGEGKQADIVFVLDRSSSIDIQDFNYQLTIVQDIVRVMDVAPNKTQIAAVSFSSTVRLEFYLDEFANQSQVIDRIGRIAYKGGNTETGKALTLVHDTVLSPEHGMRSSVPHVVIVITDGRSQDTAFTASAAALLKHDGVKMIAIGVGHAVLRRELESIASKPYQDYLFEVDGYQALHTIQYILAIKACNTTAPPPTPTLTLPPATTTHHPENNQTHAEEVCGDGKQADIVFVLDRSSSIDIRDFHYQLKIVQDIVRVMDIAPNKTQIGAVSFSSNVMVEFFLNNSTNKSQVIDRIGHIAYTGGNTETGQALNMVHNAVLSPEHGARSSVPHVVIVITDGRSQDASFTESAAALLKHDGVKMIAIGVGPEVLRLELEHIASKPYQDYLFEIDGYQALHTIQYILAIKACETNNMTMAMGNNGNVNAL